ncbi:MAG TPA: TIM-barrel domain-containing protein [Cytophagaceae bacterium]|jgi:alpha-glucosidase|nr:TIM-barrel domain-containing protein [Cytophagaceae bacterium]
MRKKYTPFLIIRMFLCGIGIAPLIAQTNYSTNDSIAIFYPKDFDAIQTMPSFAINEEPAVQSGIPAGWQIKPIFSGSSDKTIATVQCGKVDFYGTGEVTGTLKRNNTSITLWNSDNYGYEKYDGKRLYQSHPWVMGLRPNGTAFGILADNTWKMDIDITNTSVVFTSDGPAFRVLVLEAATPQKLIKKLAALTGKIELPPLWSLGYQQCRYSYMNEAEVKSIADKFRSKQLPCDVLWMDIDYMDKYKIFTFSPSEFSNPKGLNDYLHAQKFKSVWMIDPGIKQETGYSIYEEGNKAVGTHWVHNSTEEPFVGDVWPGPCVFPDYTRPETRKWWGGLYTDFMAQGIDGVWNDMNEPSVFKGGEEGTMPMDAKHRGGGNLPAGAHLRYHNVYGRLMVQASREGILHANPTKRPFLLSRSNFLGGQKYAATWTGDNQSTKEHMRLSIPMVLTMGLSGQPISGPDVGGFKGDCPSTLLAHWMALGAFYPFYRNHSDKETIRQEPWAYNTATEQSCRISLQRRYRLLPYLYTLAQEASTNGTPIMCPMFFADPLDLNLRDQEETFLVGDILMIVPKWATEVKYPKGNWNIISLVGENSKTDKFQPDVLLKGGSILPLGQIIQSTVDYTTDSLTLIIALDSNEHAKGYLYHDSGDGFDYKNGQYNIRDFTIKPMGVDSLIFTVTARSGQLPFTNCHYRIGLVKGTDIIYTNWINDTTIKILK